MRAADHLAALLAAALLLTTGVAAAARAQPQRVPAKAASTKLPRVSAQLPRDALGAGALGGSALPQVRLMGRFQPGLAPGQQLAQLPQWMSWGASAAIVSFQGSGSVSVVLDASPESMPAEDRWLPTGPDIRFQFVIDGAVVGVAGISRDSPLLTWEKTGLSPGRHNLTITKITQARLGAAWLRSIQLLPGGTFRAPPPTPGMASGRRLLFIGDSLTAGTGNTANSSCQPGGAVNENTLLAWGPVAARALGADYQNLGWGAGTLSITQRSQFGNNTVLNLFKPRMRTLLHRADALNPGSQYQMDSFQPQVVVLAAGTNDFNGVALDASHRVVSRVDAPLPPLPLFLAEHEALVKEIRAAYPQAAIVTLVWPFEMLLAGLRDLQSNAAYQQYMAATATHLAMARISNTYLLQLSGSSVDSSDYCSGHPDRATHAQVAAQVVKFIQAALPDF